MALARTIGGAGVRGTASILLSAALVASVAFVDAQWTWAGFPFLTLPAPPPLQGWDTVYMPVLSSTESALSSSMRLAQGDGGVELELTNELASGELRMWESTHDDARVAMAVGAAIPLDTYKGAHATWQIARTADGWNVVSARIKRTLVVIVAPIAVEELLRIADSLRETRAGSLIL